MLVVDDEADLASAVAATLEEHAFATLEAGTLAEAQAHLAEADLILLDLNLPDGDGLTVCASLAEAAPVIIISARGDVVDRVTALEMGADDYLPKPFSLRRAGAASVVTRERSGQHDLGFLLDQLPSVFDFLSAGWRA